MNKRLRTWFMAIAALMLVFALCGSVLAEEAAAEAAPAANMFQQSFWSLIPAIIAIGLALITKEVYSSLFVGILTGGLKATAGGITVAIVSGLIVSLIFKPRDKT